MNCTFSGITSLAVIHEKMTVQYAWELGDKWLLQRYMAIGQGVHLSVQLRDDADFSDIGGIILTASHWNEISKTHTKGNRETKSPCQEFNFGKKHRFIF